MSSNIPFTLIIADCTPEASIADCLKNLSSWSPRKIIVSNNLNPEERFPDNLVAESIFCDSKSILRLWERGIKESKTQWNLLITSNEIVTGQLKISIEKQVKNDPNSQELFKLKKKIIFLKKVLKYPLEWPCEFPSSLVFIPDIKNFSLEPGRHDSSSFLEGELVHFSKPSLNESVQEITRLAENYADNKFLSGRECGLAALILQSFWQPSSEFVNNLIFKKGFREGYEGVVFSVLGGMISLLGLLRYYEKYFREGGKIARNKGDIKNVLVIKLGGAGDVILATPVIRNLKNLIPDVKLHVLVLKDVASLLDNNPYIDSTTLINFDDSAQEIVKIADSFNQYNMDLTINLQSTNFSTKVLKKISSRWKINRSYYFRDKFTDVLVGFANTYRSVIDRDLDILRSIGLEPVDKFTEVFPAEDEVAWAKQFFSENGLSRDKKTVIVHPCSSLAIRSWGIENFALVCKNLISEDHCQIIINCSPKELDSVAPINNLAPEVCVFSGSLRELLALINEADLFVGNDSGPSQFSAALNIPTITMNGPSTSSIYRDPDLFQGQHYTFNKEVHCRDLFHSQCMLKTDPVTNHPVCDEMICLDFTVEEVTLKAQELLKSSGKRNPE